MTTTQDGPMTVARLSELHPDLVKSVRESAFAEGKAAGHAEGLSAERKRTSQILKRSTASQFELAQKLITEGKDSETATDELLADPRRTSAQDRARLEASSPPVIPPTNPSAATANETFEEQCKRLWASKPEIHEEYLGVFERFMALERREPQHTAAKRS